MAHTIRSQHQLGDFLFSSDMAKLRQGKKYSQSSQSSPSLENRARSNMNNIREDKIVSSILSLDNRTGNSRLASKEGVTNLNYVNNKNSSKKERRKEQVDNAKFQGKNSRSTSRSPKSKTRKELKQKEHFRNEETKVVAMDLEEDTEEDRRKSLNLQAEIEKEQEYQNQINLIYNSPNYFEQYSADLMYRAEFHNPVQDQFILDPQIVVQNPPMYFIAAPQLHFESQLLYFPSVDDSCDLSDSGSSGSSDTSDSESSQSQDFHNFYSCQEDLENNVPIELDEELNNLVLSIITD